MAVTLDYHNVRGCLTQAQYNGNVRVDSAIGRLGGGIGVSNEVTEIQNRQLNVQNDISSKISQYLIAEDDIVASLDLLGISNDKLDEMTELLKELRTVAIKAESGEYSKNELNMQAIDIITELEEIRAEAEYNGVDLFGGLGERVTFKPKHFNNENTYWLGMSSTGSIKYEEDVGANTLNTLGEFVEFDTLEKGIVIRDEDDVEIAALNFNENTTFGDFLKFFNTNGLKATIEDGYISLTSTEGLYAEDQSTNGILTQLGMNVIEKERTITVGITATSSRELSAVTTELAQGSTTLGEIITMAGSQEIVVKNSAGGSVSQAFTQDNTIDDVLIFLNANGIDAEIKSGIVTLESEGGVAWAEDMAAGGILEKMGIIAQTTVENKTITKEQVSTAELYNTTVTTATSELVATTANKFNEIGFTTGFKITVGDGTDEFTLDFGAADTIQTLVDTLNSNGVSTSFTDGKLTVDGTGTRYIVSASGEFTRLFTLSGTSYNKTVGKSVTSSEVISGITTSKKLNELGTYYSGTEAENVIKDSFTVVVHHNNQDKTISLSGTDTVQQVFNKLGAYGITGSISSDKVTISSTDSYIKEGSEGLNAIFKIQESYYKTTGINQTSAEQSMFTSIIVTPTTILAENSTRLESIGVTADQYVTIMNGSTKTEFTFTRDTTIGDLTYHLTAAGLVCHFADGKLNITESENSYVKGMSAGLKDGFKLAGDFSEVVAIKTTGVNTTSPVFELTGNSQIDFEDELSAIGVATTEIITVIQDGTEKSITINNKTTVRSFISLFNSVGIGVEVENNKFTLIGSEDAYIRRIPSSLQNKLAIVGESYTTAIDITRSNDMSDRHFLIFTRTLSTTDTLDKIGINGTQSMVISENGLSDTIFFTNTDTIKDVFNKLQSKGIDAEITKGGVVKLSSKSASVDSVSSVLKQALKISVNKPKGKRQTSMQLPDLGVVDRHIITVKGSTPKEKGDFSYDAALSFTNLADILDDGIEMSGAKGIIENILYDVEKLQKEVNTIYGKLESKLNRAITERDAIIAQYSATNSELTTSEMVAQILNSARSSLLESNPYDTSEARKLLHAK